MAVHADLHDVDELEGDLDEQEEAARAYLGGHRSEEEDEGEDDVEDEEEEAELPPRGISPEPDAKNDAPPPTKTGRPAPDDGKRTNVRARAPSYGTVDRRGKRVIFRLSSALQSQRVKVMKAF